jgi:hypothetical protein
MFSPPFYDLHCHLFDISHIPLRPLFRRYGGLLQLAMQNIPFLRTDDYVKKYLSVAEGPSLAILRRLAGEIELFLAQEKTDLFNPGKIILTPLLMYFQKENSAKAMAHQVRTVKKAIELFLKENDNAHRFGIYPFLGIDPTDTQCGIEAQELVRAPRTNPPNGSFIGIKLYPPLRIDIESGGCDDLFKWCEHEEIPITVHCSRDGFYSDHLPRRKSAALSDPSRWFTVLKKFPELRVNFAHLGGMDSKWVESIRKLMIMGKHVYTDVSYILHKEKKAASLVKKLLATNTFGNRILFGSDYYMTLRESSGYSDMVVPFKRLLTAPGFNRIAVENPGRFFGGGEK